MDVKDRWRAGRFVLFDTGVKTLPLCGYREWDVDGRGKKRDFIVRSSKKCATLESGAEVTFGEKTHQVRFANGTMRWTDLVSTDLTSTYLAQTDTSPILEPERDETQRNYDEDVRIAFAKTIKELSCGEYTKQRIRI